MLQQQLIKLCYRRLPLLRLLEVRGTN